LAKLGFKTLADDTAQLTNWLSESTYKPANSNNIPDEPMKEEEEEESIVEDRNVDEDNTIKQVSSERNEEKDEIMEDRKPEKNIAERLLDIIVHMMIRHVTIISV
jgi:hypothetical protein